MATKLQLVSALLPLTALARYWWATRRRSGALRILHLADHLGYPDGVRHGVTTYILQVLGRLRSNGNVVHAAFLRQEHPAAAELRRQQVACTFLGRSRGDPRTLPALLRLIRDFDPDVIVATQMETTTLVRALRLSLPRWKLVMHVHDTDPLSTGLRLAHHLLPPPDLAICVSQPARRTATNEYGVPRRRTTVVHNGIDVQRFEVGAARIGEFRNALGLTPAQPVIGRVARMHADKCNDRLVRVLPQLLAVVPDLVVLFAGDGPERTHCEALARTLGVEGSVRFLGQRDDVELVTAACDVLAITTPEEPFGFAVIEAMAAGRPVVGFAAGGLPELIRDGVDGLLARPEDLDHFASLLLRLLLDPQLRAALGARAKLVAHRHSLQAHVDEMEQRLAGVARRSAVQ